ncbi:MAG: oligosaccharyl transferase, archaeosortase A system-associated [Methanoregula sp.]|nr:MAG: oligosaccharyl transferase, archaeosortase A system-associated [Methanoregula sp.]
MTEPVNKNYRTYLIFAIIFFFSAFALWLRLIPMFNLGNTDILYVVGSDDPLYNLRQVEQILANFPAYNWFDVMTLYPWGSTIYWGPLFPTIIAVLCILTGAATRPEIIATGLLVPPLMATALVPIMYFVGKTCGDYKTGLLASGFTAVVSGQIFYRSFYGYMDHHIAEVLFSTLFCLFYIYAILAAREQDIDLKKIGAFKKTVIFSGIAGIAYLLGLFTMPTMILFAMIVGIFTLVQSLINVYQDRSIGYLAVANSIIFSVAIIGLLGYGIQYPGLGLSLYTIGHVYAYLSLIGGTWLLYGLIWYLKGRPRYFYPAALAGIAVAFGAVLFLFLPDIYNLLVSNFISFFGQAVVTTTVQEARGWSTDLAWFAFNYGLLLFTGGALVMAYNNLKDEHPHQVFALVWSVVMFYSTWQHIRYEYYLAINIALLSAVCIHFVMERGWPEVARLAARISSDQSTSRQQDRGGAEPPKGKRHKKVQKKVERPDSFSYLNLGVMVVALGFAILFAYTSASYSYANASNNAIRMNGDWRESLEWMKDNTPETGVDYLTIYDRKTFEYPNSSYGVMSWWDYGHMITYIAKRIPNANPFQQGVAGPTGSAAYFMAESEETANGIADAIGIRYIITDIEMDEAIQGKFWAMATWYNTSRGVEPYVTTYAVPNQNDPTKYMSAPLINQHYYETMISRLHNFDGSLTNATAVYYIEYVDPSVSSVSAPVIIAASEIDAAEAHMRAALYNAKATPGYHATVANPVIVTPTDTVPALRHYRLVHESPTNVYGTKIPDVKYVKVFEYVKGAHIKGTGVIEVPLVSNTGRRFTYRQQSINGEFIVPYSTTGNPYDVKATGKYRIAGMTREFDVPENAVMQGLAIN